MLIQLKTDFSKAMSLLWQSKIKLILLDKFGKDKNGIYVELDINDLH